MSKRICSFCEQKVADHKGPTGIRCSLNTNYDFTFLKMPETKQLGEDELSSMPFQKGAKLENSDIPESAITSNTAKTPKQSLNETLSALEEENQKILDELRLHELLEKNKDLKQKLKQTDLKQKHDKTTTKVTLGGLRKDEELKQKVKDKQSRLVGKLFLSDDSEGEDKFPQTIKTLKFPRFKIKKNKDLSKSGSSRKSSDKAIVHVAWPHEFAGSDDIDFMSLSIPALVRGENFIIHNIEPTDYKNKRAEHLTQLMYYSEQYTWHNVLAFHKDILREIEAGRASWNDNFEIIKARRLNQTYPRQYCSAYNKGSCNKNEAHKNTLGLLEEHFCSSCWIKRKSFMQHPAKDCRQQSQGNIGRGRGFYNFANQNRDFQAHK